MSRSDMRDPGLTRMLRSLSSGAHSRGPLDHPGYKPSQTQTSLPKRT